MTLPLLKILGHKTSLLNWDKVNEQTVWTAMNLSFFSSCRMGELLTAKEHVFDPTANLTWADINFHEEDNVIIHIKNPKSNRQGGEFVDIFSFTGQGVCPIMALKEHRRLQIEAGLFDPHGPVFKFSNGKFLTMAYLNKLLKQLLEGVIDQSTDSISCHSFRAGIPSALARFPDLASSGDIKGWGRWDSDCYTKYTRMLSDQKRVIFNKIVIAISS